MNTLKQRRDNFQCGGKDELNLKLTFFIMASFFRNLEVLNPGIKSVKNIWNLKQVWITPKSLSHFHSFCQVFIKKIHSWGMIFQISYYKIHCMKRASLEPPALYRDWKQCAFSCSWLGSFTRLPGKCDYSEKFQPVLGWLGCHVMAKLIFVSFN